jgi:hypothetical protein
LSPSRLGWWKYAAKGRTLRYADSTHEYFMVTPSGTP